MPQFKSRSHQYLKIGFLLEISDEMLVSIEKLREKLERLDKKTAIILYSHGKRSEAIEITYFRKYE